MKASAHRTPRPTRRSRGWSSCKSLDLERLTKPSLDESAADHGRGEMVERLEDVGSSLVADDEAAEAGEPGEGSLDDPP